MKLKSKVAQNISISFIGKILSSLLGVVAITFIARKLGPDGFGNYSIVFAFLYIFSVFADFGLYNLAVREISKEKANESKILSSIITTRALLLLFSYLIILIILPFIDSYSFKVKIGIAISYIGFIFLSFSQILASIFQKHLKTVYLAFGDVVSRAFQIIAVIYLFYFTNANFIEFLMVFILGSFLNFLFLIHYAKKFISFKLNFDKRLILQNLKASAPMGISLILVLVYFKGDTIILSLLKTPTDVGIYNIAYKFIETLIFFPMMFVGIITPILTKNFSKKNLHLTKKTLQKSFDFLSLTSLPIVFGGIYFSKQIIHLLGGNAYKDAYIVLAILMIAVLFMFFGALFGNAAIAFYKQKKAMYIYGTAGIINIILNFILIEKLSYFGAAFVTVITEILVTLMLFYICYEATKFLPSMKVFIKSLLASTLMILIIHKLSINNLFIGFFIGSILYFILTYFIFKSITKDELIAFLRLRS